MLLRLQVGLTAVIALAGIVVARGEAPAWRPSATRGQEQPSDNHAVGTTKDHQQIVNSPVASGPAYEDSKSMLAGQPMRATAPDRYQFEQSTERKSLWQRMSAGTRSLFSGGNTASSPGQTAKTTTQSRYSMVGQPEATQPAGAASAQAKRKSSNQPATSSWWNRTFRRQSDSSPKQVSQWIGTGANKPQAEGKR